MDAKLQAVIDKQEIYELACRYMRGLDRWDRELLLSVFWEDGWCDYGFTKGTPEEFIDFALGALREHTANQHMIGNVLTELEGDEAFVEVYFQAYHKVKGENGYEDVIIAGRYVDRCEKRDGVWKFSYRSEIVDWSRTESTQDPYFDMAPDSFRGGRQDDAVYDRASRRKPG